jgi:hypothetical protein
VFCSHKVKWPSYAVQRYVTPENLFVIVSDVYHRRWQPGVIELLQCQQWQERSLFKARCRNLEDASDRDVLIDGRNKLGLRPFWRRAIPIEYPDPPADTPKFYTRTGTPLPDEDVNDLEDAWNPKVPDIVDGHSDGWGADTADWRIGQKTQKDIFSPYNLL